MAEQNAHINYTIADIERYLQGRMSAKEMHDMEKAALQDPFLSDAIEGYSDASIPQANTHLNEISALLQQSHKKEAKLIPITIKRFQWLRVAALIAVVAGAGLISLYVLNQNKQAKSVQNLAQEKAKAPISADTVKATQDVALTKQEPDTGIKYNFSTQKAKQKVVVAERGLVKKKVDNYPVPLRPVQQESLQKDEASAVTTLMPAAKEAGAKKDSIDAAKPTAPVPNEVAVANKPSGIMADKLNMTQQTEMRKKSFMLNKDAVKHYTFMGRILDNNQLPVAFAGIKINNTATGTTTNANGYFNFTTKDSLANVSVSAIGYESEDTVIRYNVLNNITVQSDSRSLSEVIVSSMDFEKKSDDNKPAPDKFASPITGWDSFEAYVYKKLNKPYDSTANNTGVNGDVELEFFVNDKGEPYNFKVTHSLSDSTNEKAIEIVKEGPKWTVDSKKKKGKVKIHF